MVWINRTSEGAAMVIAQVEHRDGRFLLLIRHESGEIQSTELAQDAVQALLFSASHALVSQKADPAGDPLMQPPMVDGKPVALSTGSDDQGRAVLTVQIPLMPPFRFRFDDNMARGVIDSFSEILATPMDVRISMRPN